jgi:hypothetical protein
MNAAIVSIVDEWLTQNESLKGLRQEILDIFHHAAPKCAFPERSWFGYPPGKTALSIMFGSVYLIGIFDRKIEIIVDEAGEKVMGLSTRRIELAAKNGQDLFWVSTSIDNIPDLISNNLLWKHFQLATIAATRSPAVAAERGPWPEGKQQLSSILSAETQPIQRSLIEEAFQKEVDSSAKGLRAARLERLEDAPKRPNEVMALSRQFIRNPDVVAEVLYLAQGKCGHCKADAPFLRASNGQPYLEVHHITPLSEGGDDTLENTIALCPNCHREAHFGPKDLTLQPNLGDRMLDGISE